MNMNTTMGEKASGDMSIHAVSDAPRNDGRKNRRKKGFINEISRNKYLYLLALPGMIFFLIFNYAPMFGIIIAFKDYSIGKGILGSTWCGLANFKFFFTSGHAARVTLNTLYLNGLFIFLGTIFQSLIAILLNEIRCVPYKKLTQSLMFLPYFMSWVVVGVISLSLFDTQTGMINTLLKNMGLRPVSWYTTPEVWRPLLVLFYTWKWTGYGAVIYLAVISGIDDAYYEAAVIDGAGKWAQIRNITIPMLIPTVIVLVLLAIGRIFYGDFGMIYGLIGDNGMLFRTTDVIDTYVYRALRQLGDFGMSTAVGLYQSVLGFVIVSISNHLARRFREEGALF